MIENGETSLGKIGKALVTMPLLMLAETLNEVDNNEYLINFKLV